MFRTTLLRYIKAKQWASFETDCQPYISAVQALRQFHCLQVAFEPTVELAPFHFLQSAKMLALSSAVPRQYQLAVYRLEKLMHYLQSDLTTKSVLCHGDFHLKNVLIVEEAGKIKSYLIDFDTALPGHPFFDLAKFTVSLEKSQRLQLLNVYLGRQATEREQIILEWMDTIFLMLVATNRFQWANKHLEEPHYTAQELENVLKEENLPSYLTVPFEQTTVRDRQLGAVYALAEFLKRTEPICFNKLASHL